MKKIIIIGGGFAGLNVASRLSKYGLDLEVSIFDKRGHFDFLPLIPDAIGRQINPEFLQHNISDLSGKLKFKFIKEEVVSVDLGFRGVATCVSTYAYDFLVVASGSQTNFFGNQEMQDHAYALNSVDDVKKIQEALAGNRFENFVICGGGYTGVEAATNLWRYFKKKGLTRKIIIVERAPAILGPLPDWMKLYARDNLINMEIDILANSSVEDIKEDRVAVSGGRVFTKAMVIWVAGVRTADFIQRLPVEKNPQGRIVVDEYLRFDQNCFCAGDTAYFGGKDNFLRMAVQFSITEGNHAAVNIIRSIKNLPLKKFKPLDLGYVIPMANNRSCGVVFGLKVQGMLATLLHFVMCIYRSIGLRNKMGVMAGLIKSLPQGKQGGARC
ncbi:MAG: FAD-dependent oxidoreductase [Candidatus Omnitrophota bacterium]